MVPPATKSGCYMICYKKAPTENDVQLEPSLIYVVGALGFEPVFKPVVVRSVVNPQKKGTDG